MGRLQAFHGAAGSGKTYALMTEIERVCSSTVFLAGQSILAITFMHGSRRRLNARLNECPRNGVPAHCETIDSFCLRIVNRFRRYINKGKPIHIGHDATCEQWSEHERQWKAPFRDIRKAAVELLAFPTVRMSVSLSYPVVVVDEFQDCDEDLLEVVGLLAKSCIVLLAADDFQHLSENETCSAYSWLKEVNAPATELSGNHRTSDSVLCETALALREGRPSTLAIEVHAVDGHGLVAWEIASRLAWGKISAEKSKVLLSPVRSVSSPWVTGILTSLEKELGQASKIKPKPFTWESSEDMQFEAALESMVLENGERRQLTRETLQTFETSEHPIVRIAALQGRRLLSLREERELVDSEFVDLLHKASHSISVFGRKQGSARLAMTMHGAKNREFDHVFIAWPFQVKGNDLYKRKLLYNAVTRAREGAVLFVQGGVKRVKEDPVLSLLKCGLVARKQKKPRPAKSKKKKSE